MALDHLTLTNFRNHAETRLDDTARINLLVGENGAGKTNVLEAISLLAPGRGLRRAALGSMARAGGDGGFAISARLDPGDGAEPVRLGTGTRGHQPERRIVQINGARSGAVNLGEWLAVSWLVPAMDGLFTDSAGARRRYLDRLALALDPAHARHASRYEAALRERNRLLADPAAADPAWFDSLEAQMAEAGASLARGRAGLVARLMAKLETLPDQPFARPALTYQPGCPQWAGPTGASAVESASLRTMLAANRARDRAAQRTLEGPHRDELDVRMAGRDMAAALCSTGEQKAMLIAITLAHAELSASGRPGLLLLDEVAAHLDPLRREALFEQLRAGRAQVWLTGTEPAPFAGIIGEAGLWRISDGSALRL